MRARRRLAGFLLPVLRAALAAIRGVQPAASGVQPNEAPRPLLLSPKASAPAAGNGSASDAAPPARAPAGQEAVERVEQEVRRARAEAVANGHDEAQVDEAVFALVACLDEHALRRDWPGRAAWRDNPLQRRLYDTVRAGAQFYSRLDAVDERNTDVLEMYALVLMTGFTGALAGQPLALDARRRAVIGAVEQARPFTLDALSGPDERTENVSPHLRPVWSAALVVIVPLVLLGGLYLLLETSITPMVHFAISRF